MSADIDDRANAIAMAYSIYPNKENTQTDSILKIMALADEYAEQYSAAQVPQTNPAVLADRKALLSAVIEQSEEYKLHNSALMHDRGVLLEAFNILNARRKWCVCASYWRSYAIDA
jgi:hypothetical protein